MNHETSLPNRRRLPWAFARLYTLLLLLLPVGLPAGLHAQYTTSDQLSSQYVTALTEDSQGYIWIGTTHGLNRFSGSNYLTYYSQRDSAGLNNDDIKTLMTDAEGRLWIGTECGLSVRERGRFRHLPNNGFHLIPQLADLDVEHLIVSDRNGIAKINKQHLQEEARFARNGLSLAQVLAVSGNGQVWVANSTPQAGHLIYILDNDLRLQQTLPLTAPAELLAKDSDGDIWLVTQRDIRCYRTGAHIPQERPLPAALKGLRRRGPIHFLQVYRDSCLLIGVGGQSMFCYDKRAGTLTPLHRQQRLTDKQYVCFVDSRQNIWLSDTHTGVKFYPAQFFYESLTSVQDFLTDPTIRNIAVDREGYLWMRTSNDLACYDMEDERLLYHDAHHGPYGCLLIDSKGTLWTINPYDRLNHYTLSNGRPTLRRSFHFQGNVFAVCEDREGNIWATLTDRFAIIHPDGSLSYKNAPDGVAFSTLWSVQPSGKMFLYTTNNGIYEFGDDRQFFPLDVPALNPNSVHIDRNKAYWIGTYNAGLTYYDPQTQEVRQFDTGTGLLDNNIKSITEDKEGNIWFSTSTGINKYDRQTQSCSYLYDPHFQNGKLYSLNCAATTPDGRLFFGGQGSVTIVYPDRVKAAVRDIPLSFDRVLINGEPLDDVGNKLELHYPDNGVTFYYSGLSFESGSFLHYAYRLDGFERKWNDAGNNTRASYPNLPPGDYVFRVRVKKLDGQWSQPELALPITIHPAPWASAWALGLYALTGLALLCLGVWLLLRWKMQKERLALTEREKELNQEHVDFVTNISHEFRTPLTLIYAPLQELAKDNTLSGHGRALIGTMQRNADRLMRLSTQIVDSNQSEKDEKRLQAAPADLAGFVRTLAENFRFAIHEKGLALDIHADAEVKACFDAEKVEKMLYNLISNAIKYTPRGGHIGLAVEGDGQTARIHVCDTGQGIPPEKQEQLFGRFERLDADRLHPDVNGKGVGLHYAQHLAQLHKGRISYAPNHPQGSCFTISLPQPVAAYNDNEHLLANALPPLPTPACPPPAKQTCRKTHTLLVAEDDVEVREYLRTLLMPRYNVVAVQNGEEALEWLTANPTDLVVSDVVMPRMDGYRMCRTLKSNPDLAHIPVVLLTAKGNLDERIEGLKQGADAYVGKPFDPFYLQAVVENLLENRRRIQQAVAGLTSKSLREQPGQDVPLDEGERHFLSKLYAQLDAHLADGEFSINTLAQELCISYSTLYAKVKALTGQTPQNFLSTYRMNTAMELLKTGRYTVTEVCYQVGSSSPANFSRSFKRQFGMPPSEVAAAGR